VAFRVLAGGEHPHFTTVNGFRLQHRDALSADTGYLSGRNIAYCEAQGGRMHQKVTSAHGRAIYARRKVIVEPVFGRINAALGFCRFSLRGLAKVAAEWGFVCLCRNVLKLYRAFGCIGALAS
jgi:hypothetical protein